MTLHIYEELDQGTPEWLAARCGILTASVMGQLITKGAPDSLTVDCPKCQSAAGEPCISTARKVPTPIKTIHDERSSAAAELPPVYRVASNDTSRALTLTLTAERITGHVEPLQVTQPMMRGTLDEPYARDKYAEHHAPVTELGFMVKDFGKYRIGYSPDGLVGEEGLIEIKSRAQKKHLQTILADEVPLENMAQIQTGLLVSGRKWLDYVSFCSGMPLWTQRVLPSEKWFDAITDAALTFEANAAEMLATYTEATKDLPPTERLDHFQDLELNF